MVVHDPIDVDHDLGHGAGHGPTDSTPTNVGLVDLACLLSIARGVAGLYIDDHADDRQMEALPAIIGGRAGGFPGWVNECFAGGRQSRRSRICRMWDAALDD